jgi:transposase-like protein
VINETREDFPMGSNDKLNLDNLTWPFADEVAAIRFVESLLWPDGPVCPHCGQLNEAYRLQSHSEGNGKRAIRKGLWKCGGCRKQFTVRVSTAFEESKLPLRKWLMAIHLMCCAKKGVSSHQVARQIGCTQKTAWFLCHRVRECMKLEPLAGMLGGAGKTLEADETHVGGKPRNGTGPHNG